MNISIGIFWTTKRTMMRRGIGITYLNSKVDFGRLYVHKIVFHCIGQLEINLKDNEVLNKFYA